MVRYLFFILRVSRGWSRICSPPPVSQVAWDYWCVLPRPALLCAGYSLNSLSSMPPEAKVILLQQDPSVFTFLSPRNRDSFSTQSCHLRLRLYPQPSSATQISGVSVPVRSGRLLVQLFSLCCCCCCSSPPLVLLLLLGLKPGH